MAFARAVGSATKNVLETSKGWELYRRLNRDVRSAGGSQLDTLGVLYNTDNEVNGLVSSPGRLQLLHQNALWADSTGQKGSRFSDLEQRLVDEGQPTDSMRGLGRVMHAQRAGRATNIAQGIAQRQTRALGLRLSPEEQAAVDRRFGLERILNRVDAQNLSEQAMNARRQLVRDYSFEAEGERQNQTAGALSSAAQSETEREATRLGVSAGKRAERNAMIGQGIGLVAGLAMSHSSFKDHVTAIGDGEILEGLRRLDVNRWQYKGEEVQHLGPMAEDFQRVFGVGDGVTLHAVDVMGVLIGAVRELAQLAQEDSHGRG